MNVFPVLAAALVLLAEYGLVLGVSPLLTGWIRRIKARSQHRAGPPLLQPYREVLKLLRKDRVYSQTSSGVTRAAPWLSFAALLSAIPLVPWLLVPSPLSFSGDLILLVGLFALSRFLTATAALDQGSTFGGMGSTREMWVGALAEPAFVAIIFAWGAPARATDASAIAAYGIAAGWAYITPALLLATVAFALLVLAEGGRLPFDNPATHLELTMTHEAMVLDYSGPDLALVEWGQSIKITLLVGLLVAVALPWGLATTATFGALTVASLATLAKLAVGTSAVGYLETRVAKWRLFRLADLLTLASALGLGAIALAYLVGGGA